MKDAKLWRDSKSGHLWAIEVTKGRITGCHGPLREGDLRGLDVDHLQCERNPDLLQSLEKRRADFSPHTTSGEAA